MRYKLGDIIIFSDKHPQMPVPEIGVVCNIEDNESYTMENLWTPERFLPPAYVSHRKASSSWKSVFTGIYFRLFDSELKGQNYTLLGNIFELDNLEDVIKGLTSQDELTRNFFVDVLKSKLK